MAKKNIQTELDQLANFRGLLADPKSQLKQRHNTVKNKVYGSRNEISALLVERLEDYPTVADLVGDLNNVLKDTNSGVKSQLLGTEPENSDPAVRIIVEDSQGLKIKGETTSKPIIRELSEITDYDEVGNGELKYASILLNIPTLITPTTLNLEKTLLFMDMVPTHELSRCVPYVDIRMISASRPVEKQKLTGLTVYKHVAGDVQTTQKNSLNLLASAKDAQLQNESSENTVSGMELFTLPQTLVPLATSKSARLRRMQQGGDIFRSFLTLTSISFNKTFSGGMIGFESGTMELILHDRTNLADVADLINPEYYSRVRFEITYGWSHPDEANNVYGQLIKSTRKTALFQVTKTTYTIEKTGQVKITANIAATGARETTRVKISQAGSPGETVLKNSLEEIQRLTTAIRELLRANPKLSGKNKNFTPVRGSQLITAAKNPAGLIAKDPKLAAEILAFINGIRSSDVTSPGALKDLRATLKSAFGKNSPVSKAGQAIDTIVNKRIKALIDGDDPWIDQRLKVNSFSNITAERKVFLEERLRGLIGSTYAKQRRIPPAGGYAGGGKKKGDKPKKQYSPDAGSLYGTLRVTVINESNMARSRKVAPARRAAAKRRLIAAKTKFAKVKDEAQRIIEQLKRLEKINKTKKGKNTNENFKTILRNELKMVSLGKIVHEFVLKPLAGSGNFTEVQALYYPLNAKAGRAGLKWQRNTPVNEPSPTPINIGSYLVDYSLFKEEFSNYTKRKGTVELQVNEFLGFLFNTFTDDVRSWMYGLTSLYAPRGAHARSKGAKSKQYVRRELLKKAKSIVFKQEKGKETVGGYEGYLFVDNPDLPGEKIKIPPGDTVEVYSVRTGTITQITNTTTEAEVEAIKRPFDAMIKNKKEGTQQNAKGAGTNETKKQQKVTNKNKPRPLNKDNADQQLVEDIDVTLNGYRPPGDKSPRWKWKQPNVECIIESGTPRGKKADQEKPILRIHIYDRTASSYKTQQAIIKEATIGALSGKNLERIKELISEEFDTDQYKKAGRIEDIPINTDTIKQFMYDTTPSIKFGSNNNIMIDASLSSIDDSALETINISKNKYSPLAPPGIDQGGVPLRVSMAILDTTLIGCSTIDLMQQYFIDFGTDTTLDALYTVTSVSHTLTPGKFSTNVKFSPMDGWGEFITFRQAIGLDED